MDQIGEPSHTSDLSELIGLLRGEVLRWHQIWNAAGDIQRETGRHGDVDNWVESGWKFANQCASQTTPELLNRTALGLGMLATFLDNVRRFSEELDDMEPVIPPSAFGRLRAALDAVSAPDGGYAETVATHERVCGRTLDPQGKLGYESRIMELEVQVGYWANVAAQRRTLFEDMHRRLSALEERAAVPPMARDKRDAAVANRVLDLIDTSRPSDLTPEATAEATAYLAQREAQLVRMYDTINRLFALVD